MSKLSLFAVKVSTRSRSIGYGDGGKDDTVEAEKLRKFMHAAPR